MPAPRKCDHTERVWRNGALRCVICTRNKNRERMRRTRGYGRPRKASVEAIQRRRPAAQLRNGYIRNLLSARNGLPTHAWPRYLVELKRASVQLKRRLWNSPLLIAK